MRLAATSAPAPVSASPPSFLSPTSRLGRSAMPCPTTYPLEASSAVRTRVTTASVAANRPAGPSTASLPVPTHSASALNASPKPPRPASTKSPLTPPASIDIESPPLRAIGDATDVGRDRASPGVKLSEPFPVSGHAPERDPLRQLVAHPRVQAP